MPNKILELIKDCVKHKRVLWTYHINMRLIDRFIPRELILSSYESYQIIESYPQDKSLPCYLVLAEHENQIFHILFAVNKEHNTITIITAYKPSVDKWEKDFRTRKQK